VTREARPARPLARVLPLFERCRALLDAWPLTAPVIGVRVAIVSAAPLTGEQGDLLSTSWRDLGAADAALERLRAELGTDAIVRAEARDTHRPERAGVWRELQSESLTRSPLRGCSSDPLAASPLLVGPAGGLAARSSERTARGSHDSRLAIHDSREVALPAANRAFDPPETVDVVCDGDVPREVTWRGHRIAVTRAVGPERLSGDWWDDGYRRDYWHCESLAGEMTLFLDRASDGWRLQGWGD
jgi:nucleotidyltransferase/DNA polymerase involved in DNA repair